MEAALSVLTSELKRVLHTLERAAATKAVVEAVQARETCIMIRKGPTFEFPAVKGTALNVLLQRTKDLTCVAGTHRPTQTPSAVSSSAPDSAVAKGSGISFWLEPTDSFFNEDAKIAPASLTEEEKKQQEDEEEVRARARDIDVVVVKSAVVSNFINASHASLIAVSLAQERLYQL